MKKKPEIVDPQQITTLSNYLDPESETFGDLKNSAIRAGFSESYADNLFNLMPKWLSVSIGQNTMLKKAERNLDEFLDMDEKGEPALKKIKADITKFVASRAGKGKWSEKQEIETKNLNINVDLNPQSEALAKEYEEKIRKLITGEQ